MKEIECIHTTIPKTHKKKLLEYGKGSLKDGISSLLELVEKQQINITISTEVIL